MAVEYLAILLALNNFLIVLNLLIKKTNLVFKCSEQKFIFKSLLDTTNRLSLIIFSNKFSIRTKSQKV